jgi:hypothetical protein
MLMALFMFKKWWKVTTKKPLGYIIDIYFKFSKKKRFMIISKIELKCFQINLTLELFMCLRLELLELLFNFYTLGVTFFLSKNLSQFLAKFLFF